MRLLVLGAAALAASCMATPVAAQTVRATGTVHDTAGRAIRSATIRAVNPTAFPSEITSTTDSRGRWAMLGLRIGTWSFIAEAPGFATLELSQTMNSSSRPMSFTLVRDPGSLPGALDRNIPRQLDQAATWRAEGQYDRALRAYEEIYARNPTLTTLNLVIAGLYRQQAAQEVDPAVRQVLLDRAVRAYDALLASDDAHPFARAERESVRAEAAASH